MRHGFTRLRRAHKTPISGVIERIINEISAFHPLLKPLNADFDHQKPSVL